MGQKKQHPKAEVSTNTAASVPGRQVDGSGHAAGLEHRATETVEDLMQFIQRDKGYINLNRVVRIDPLDSGYNVLRLSEHNKAESFTLSPDNTEVLQYLLSR